MKSDTQLQHDVIEELKWDPFLSTVAPQIGVTSKNGVITLSGKIDSYIRKHAVEAAAQRVDGVTFVAIDLEVMTTDKHDDSEIAAAIKEAFKHLSILDYEVLDVRVDDGFVTLDGVLRWNYQRQAAEEYVRNVTGVRGITNNIVLTDQPCNAKTIIEQINAAFHRNATLDAAAVRAEVKGKKVILTGKVRSWIEKKDAENVAWSSPGITQVDNRIEVLSPYVN